MEEFLLVFPQGEGVPNKKLTGFTEQRRKAWLHKITGPAHQLSSYLVCL